MPLAPAPSCKRLLITLSMYLVESSKKSGSSSVTSISLKSIFMPPSAAGYLLLNDCLTRLIVAYPGASTPDLSAEHNYVRAQMCVNRSLPLNPFFMVFFHLPKPHWRMTMDIFFVDKSMVSVA